MSAAIGAPILDGERVRLRPLAEGDLEPLVEMVRSEGVREWWTAGAEDDPARIREELANEWGGAWAIEVGGELAGWLGFGEESDPDYRFASLDITLAPAFQDRGLGPEALRVAIDWLAAERAHHRIQIDPAADNARAIAAYRKVGFRPVGVVRGYERTPEGTWRGALLMNLLVEELEQR